MKRKLTVLFSMLFLLLAALTAGNASDAGLFLRGRVQTFESSKPEAAKKNKSKKNKEKTQESSGLSDGSSLKEDGSYTSKEDVAAYLHEYGHLPSNFITKKEAKSLGWVSNEGNLGEVAPGKSIGGDYFGNYEGKLPEKKGRSYYECDIDSTGGYRGAKRIIFSNDGLIYYTEDHYNTFEQLY